MNKRKSLYAVMLLMIAVVICGTAVLGMSLTPNVTQEGLSASVDDGIMPLIGVDIDPAYDRFISGLNHESAFIPVFIENPWNGEIEVLLHLGADYFIYIKVDARNSLTNDNVVISYRSYYLDTNYRECTINLKEFYFEIDFYGGNKSFRASGVKNEDYEATFTRYSGMGNVYKVVINIWSTGHNGLTRPAGFYFVNSL